MPETSDRLLLDKARAILAQFSGYPDLPNGRPSGVWAYTLANSTRRVRFAHTPGGHVRRLPDGVSASKHEVLHSVDLPRLDPSSSRPARLYYAAIETDPCGVSIATMPKGTQDLIASKDGARFFVELGQKASLLALLARLCAQAELPKYAHITDASARRAAELDWLHERIIKALLERGYTLEIESMLDTAIRETREEHGFDLCRERERVRRIDLFVEESLSKRLVGRPIAHHIYAAWVPDFEQTLPRVSRIQEEKNPAFEGGFYQERGVYLTLPQMWMRFAEAQAVLARTAGCPGVEAITIELDVTASRLCMLERVDRALVAQLRREGIAVSSELTDGPTAEVVQSFSIRDTPLASAREPVRSLLCASR